MPLILRKKASERLEEMIEGVKKQLEGHRLEAARYKGQIDTLTRISKDNTTSALLTLMEGLMHESTTRISEDLTSLEALKMVIEEIEQSQDHLDRKVNQTNDSIELMLGIDGDTPEKEKAERAKEAGEIYKEITRRRRGDPR